MRRTWLIVLVACFAGIGCEEHASPPPSSSSSPPVIHAERVTVERLSLPASIEVTGVVMAKTRATLAPKIGGLVRSVTVREGDRVRKGKPVVRLDDAEIGAHVARAKAVLDNARIQYERMQGLYREDSVAKQELDNAERAFRVAKAQYRAAVLRLQDTVIHSPLDGYVTERSIEPGEFAGPGQPLLTVEDPNSLQFHLHVPEQHATSLERGRKLSLIIDALAFSQQDTSITGTIVELVPASDPATHTVLVKLDLPRIPGLRSGMFGRGFLVGEPRSTLAVPLTSLVYRHDLTGVYVVGPDSGVRLRWVKTGRQMNGTIEILSGLNEGEYILRDASKGIDGAKWAQPESTSSRISPDRTTDAS
ncbi:MAG: efflux RND transporter periplasmic adaptor subunit [Nitrospirae bacterium]|nr:MAG: efflux RND transporter periplasmic adaptor subunit [Nitrospirota bacterium]